MGLLGNVAEVQRLRYRLMTTEYITVFGELLDSQSDGIEVSYNAAGVLAHITSDGANAWNISEPSREDVLNRMILAIERWSLSTERNINYRSFEPILGLIKCFDTPACQLWAVWALANLTKVSFKDIVFDEIFLNFNIFLQVYPQKYCRLVEEEHGIPLLEDLINHMETCDKLKELAQMVLDQCESLRDVKMMLEE